MNSAVSRSQSSLLGGVLPTLLLFIGLLGATARSSGEETLYVDAQLSGATSTSYDPATRKAAGGSAKAFKSLKDAAEAATAGQTVLVRGGTYAEALAPKNSGAEGKYITFRAQQGEEA